MFQLDSGDQSYHRPFPDQAPRWPHFLPCSLHMRTLFLLVGWGRKLTGWERNQIGQGVGGHICGLRAG